MRSRLNTSRVRPEASAATIVSTPPVLTSMRRESRASVVPGRSTASRAGLSMVNVTGAGGGPSSNSRTSTCSPGCGTSSTFSRRVPACDHAAGAASASIPASAASAVRLRARAAAGRLARRWLGCNDAAVMLGSPCRSFAQRYCRGPLHEAAHPVRDDLRERDLSFLDGRDAAVVLAHPVARQDPVHQPVLCLDESVCATTHTQRSHHAQRVERKLLEELARAVH